MSLKCSVTPARRIRGLGLAMLGTALWLSACAGPFTEPGPLAAVEAPANTNSKGASPELSSLAAAHKANPGDATAALAYARALRSSGGKVEAMAVLDTDVEEWTRQWKVEDLFHAGQARRLCFAPVLTMAGLARQEQLRARNFFVEVQHPRAGTLTHLGAPYQLHEPWWQIRRPAPLLGEHNTEVISHQLSVISFQY